MIDNIQNRGGDSVVPLLTVAMPIYNAGEYLRLAVLSIVKQTFTDWELLIIDDGSTDNALSSLADINDPRIQTLNDGKNKGLAVRLNECIDLARGQYFARMDQDDVSYPQRFERQIDALQKDPTLDLVAVRAIRIDESNNLNGFFPFALTHGEICAKPWMGFYFPHPTWMGRIEWFRKHRYIVPGPYFCEDQELLLRSHSDSLFATEAEVLFAYRIRCKKNWQKLAKTRCSVLKVQWKQFSSAKQWFLALLAIVSFAAKIISDFAKRIVNRLHINSSAINDSSVVNEWYAVLDELEKKSKKL